MGCKYSLPWVLREHLVLDPARTVTGLEPYISTLEDLVTNDKERDFGLESWRDGHVPIDSPSTRHVSLTDSALFCCVSTVVKAAAGVVPAAVAVPAFAMDSVVEALPTSTVSLMVQEGAYLAVLLGTLLPVLFLINLFIQTESRAAGRAGGQDAE